MYQYQQFLQANPSQIQYGGHGDKDPQNKITEQEEDVYKKHEAGN